MTQCGRSGRHDEAVALHLVLDGGAVVVGRGCGRCCADSKRRGNPSRHLGSRRIETLDPSKMSCDYAVWFPHQRPTHREAGALYVGLCEGTIQPPPENPAIEAFYEELTAQHPEIDEMPEDEIEDNCLWNVAFDRSSGHIIMCCRWSKADYAGQLIQSLAAKHGLVFYDPQSNRVTYPGGEPAQKQPWWRWW